MTSSAEVDFYMTLYCALSRFFVILRKNQDCLFKFIVYLFQLLRLRMTSAEAVYICQLLHFDKKFQVQKIF